MTTRDRLPEPPSTALGRLLNLAGIGVIGYSLAAGSGGRLPAVVLVLSIVALGAWLVSVVLPGSALRLLGAGPFAVMIVAGSLVTPGTHGLLVVPATIGVLRVFGLVGRPLWWGICGAAVGIGLVGVGAVFSPVEPLALVSMEAGVLVAALVGLSRRQFRLAEHQSLALLEERVSIREQQARAEVLEQRQALARDIHDVLAHSLGALVIQLDAVEALLEAGRTADASTRVHDARRLAVAGLDDARRAVGALRETGTVPSEQLARSVEGLVSAHRELGGTVEFGVNGDPGDLHRIGFGAAESAALVRALQEGFTNARRHAPGAPVGVTIDWSGEGVHLVVSNPMVFPTPGPSISTTQTPAAGGGHGLAGMAERFAAIGRATLWAGEREGLFVIDARVPAATRAPDGSTEGRA
ncbi:histidine kinase [Lacisediminihabitans sp. FW035]